MGRFHLRESAFLAVSGAAGGGLLGPALVFPAAPVRGLPAFRRPDIFYLGFGRLFRQYTVLYYLRAGFRHGAALGAPAFFPPEPAVRRRSGLRGFPGPLVLRLFHQAALYRE